MSNSDPRIHVTVAASTDDPRAQHGPDGVVLHRVPHLHPDDVVTLPDGLRVTSVARTLIDLAEELDRDELRKAFRTARNRGILDLVALRACRARIEWRPSLEVADAVIAEFDTKG